MSSREPLAANPSRVLGVRIPADLLEAMEAALGPKGTYASLIKDALPLLDRAPKPLVERTEPLAKTVTFRAREDVLERLERYMARYPDETMSTAVITALTLSLKPA